MTILNASGTSQTIGYTAIAATEDSGASNYIGTWRFVMPDETGTAHSLSVYISGLVSAAPNNQFQVAIYADQNGQPGTLLISTPSQTIVPDSWNTISLTATLQPNTYYWLAYNTNGKSSPANNIRVDPGSPGQMRWRPQSFGTWPATMGAANGSEAAQASIYVTYTVP